MHVHKCKGFQISHAFVVHEIPHMEEALDRCITLPSCSGREVVDV